MAKRKGKRIFKALFYAFVFAILLLIFHYLYFEISRIEGYNVKLFEDWRSYIAYVFSKIPFLKERIEYKPMKIGNASEHYKLVFSGISKDLSDELKRIESKEKEVQKLQREYENLINVLKSVEKKWKDEMKNLEMRKEEYSKADKRIEDLAQLFQSSDPAQIVSTISQESMSVETIAAVLKRIPKDVAVEIIQELSKVDPGKSASILNAMGGVEKTLEKIEKARSELERTLEKTLDEMEKLVNMESLRSALKEYMEEMSAEDVVKLVMDLELDIDTTCALLSTLSKSKLMEVLKILQTDHPDVFKKVVERGVGG